MVGSDGRARVADFGLARPTDDLGSVDAPGLEPAWPDLESTGEAATDPERAVAIASPPAALTATGTILGTPAYMSPEQLDGHRGDSRSDQFSFCVTLYEALYGVRPFDAPSIGELRQRIERGQIELPPSSSEVPARARKVLMRGLSLDPDARYPNLSEAARRPGAASARTPPVARVGRRARHCHRRAGRWRQRPEG